MKKYISDELTADEMIEHCLDETKTSFILANTGRGKTTFVFKDLIPECLNRGMKVLYFCNRLSLRRELKEKYDGLLGDNFYIKSYQSLERHVLNEEYFHPFEEEFDLIIADECHYFVTDSKLNDNTHLSFKWINRTKGALFITATPEPLNYIEHMFVNPRTRINDKSRPVKKDEKEAIRQIMFTTDYNQTNMLVEKILELGKQVFITSNNSDRVLDYHKSLGGKIINGVEKTSSFICSATNKKSKFITEGIEDSLSKSIVPTDVLATTSVVQEGISFPDFSGGVFTLGLPSFVQVVQAAGRVRYNSKYDSDYTQAILIVEIPHALSLYQKLRSIEEDLSYFEMDFEEWKKETGRKKSPSFIWEKYEGEIDGKKMFSHESNEMLVALLRMEKDMYGCIVEEGRGMTSKNYKKMILSFFQSAKEVDPRKFLLSNGRIDLSTYENRLIVKGELDDLKDKISKEIFKKTTSQILKKYLDENGYKITIKSKYIDGKKSRAWLIEKND